MRKSTAISLTEGDAPALEGADFFGTRSLYAE